MSKKQSIKRMYHRFIDIFDMWYLTAHFMSTKIDLKSYVSEITFVTGCFRMGRDNGNKSKV